MPPPLAPMLLNSCPRYYHHTHTSNRQRENTTHHTLQLHLHLNLAQHKILLLSTTNVKAVVWQSTFQCSFPPHSHSLPSSWDMDWIKLDLAEEFFSWTAFLPSLLIMQLHKQQGEGRGQRIPTQCMCNLWPEKTLRVVHLRRREYCIEKNRAKNSRNRNACTYSSRYAT